MADYTRATEFRMTQTQRTILCGLVPPGATQVQISDSSFEYTDPDSGVTDRIGAATWWKVLSTKIDAAGTLSAEVAFEESSDLLAWLCANNQVVQIYIKSIENFTVDAKFVP